MDRTAPLLSFEYDNAYKAPVGFDLHAEFGIMAAADENGRIQIYSLRTGKKIWSLEDKGITARSTTEDWIRCIRIVEDEQGRPKMFASIQDRIEEFAW